MTVETFLVVVLMLVVKYTIEFADRTRLRRRRRGRRPAARRDPAARVIDFSATHEPASAATAGPADDAPPPDAVEDDDATGDPFWDMVTARIRDADDAPSAAGN